MVKILLVLIAYEYICMCLCCAVCNDWFTNVRPLKMSVASPWVKRLSKLDRMERKIVVTFRPATHLTDGTVGLDSYESVLV